MRIRALAMALSLAAPLAWAQSGASNAEAYREMRERYASQAKDPVDPQADVKALVAQEQAKSRAEQKTLALAGGAFVLAAIFAGLYFGVLARPGRTKS